MFILLNGPFGIGKSTTARALAERVAAISIYDPEPLGIALQHLSTLFRSHGRIADFQNSASWRRLTAWGARLRHREAGAVIVPMAFTNLRYVDELANALTQTAPVQRLCLVAPIDVVRQRLATRSENEEQGT